MNVVVKFGSKAHHRTDLASASQESLGFKVLPAQSLLQRVFRSLGTLLQQMGQGGLRSTSRIRSEPGCLPPEGYCGNDKQSMSKAGV